MFKWLFGTGKKPSKATHSPTAAANTSIHQQSFSYEIVGESFYQDTLEDIAQWYSDESAELYFDATLVTEPNNRYDPNAIAVKIENRKVGHVPKDQTDQIRALMGARVGEKKRMKVAAVIVGGWKRASGDGHFGVKLNL